MRKVGAERQPQGPAFGGLGAGRAGRAFKRAPVAGAALQRGPRPPVAVGGLPTAPHGQDHMHRLNHSAKLPPHLLLVHGQKVRQYLHSFESP